MSQNLRFIHGATTLSLVTSNVYLVNQSWGAPTIADQDIESLRITSTFELFITGADSTDVQDKIAEIEQLLSIARLRQRRAGGTRVYLHNTMGGELTTWRTEVTDGRILTPSDLYRAWSSAGVPVTLVVERKVYFERTDEVTAEASTSILNTGYIDIAAADVVGSLPAPAKITVHNRTGGALAWYELIFGCNVFNDPAAFDASLSGTSISWGGAVDHTTEQANWLISDSRLEDMQGDYFHVVICYTAITSGAYYRAAIQIGSTTVWTGKEVLSSLGATVYEVQDLGALPFPPGGYSAYSTDVNLSLSVRDDGAGSATISEVLLLPAMNFRKLRIPEGSVGDDESVIDDGPADQAYLHDSSGARLDYTIGRTGMPIMLYPGEDHRLYTVAYVDNNFDTTWDIDVGVTYRPRRLTV